MSNCTQNLLHLLMGKSNSMKEHVESTLVWQTYGTWPISYKHWVFLMNSISFSFHMNLLTHLLSISSCFLFFAFLYTVPHLGSALSCTLSCPHWPHFPLYSVRVPYDCLLFAFIWCMKLSTTARFSINSFNKIRHVKEVIVKQNRTLCFLKTCSKLDMSVWGLLGNAFILLNLLR